MEPTGGGPKRWARFVGRSVQAGAAPAWHWFGVIATVIGITFVGVLVAVVANPVRGAVAGLAALLVVGFVGSYRLWDAERRRADNAEEALQAARAELDRRPSQVRVELGGFLNRGNRLLWDTKMAGIQKTGGDLHMEDGTPIAFFSIDFVAEFINDWKREVHQYLREHVGKDHAELFRTDVGVPEFPCPFDAEVAKQEADYYRYMQRRIWRLQRIMERVP